MSGLKEYLSKALNSSSPEETIKYLKTGTEVLKSGEKLDLSGILSSLKKIGKNLGVKSYLPLLELYSELLKRISQLTYYEQCEFLNDIHQFCALMPGCYAADELLIACEEAIKGSSQLLAAKEIVSLFELPNSIDEKLKSISDEIIQENLGDLSSIITLFSDCPTLKMQNKIFEDKIEGFLLSIEKKIDSFIILDLVKIIENFVFPVNYSLTIPDAHIGEYKLAQPRYSEHILKIVQKILADFIVSEKKARQQILRILNRLWDEDSMNNELLFDISKILLDNIEIDEDIENEPEASHLLYKLMNTSIKKSLKNSLETDNLLRPLFDSLDYKPSQLVSYSPEEAFDKIGYALNAYIKAGENFDYFINIETPNSVLVWGFVCLHYDIAVKLTRVSDNFVLIPETRIKCDTSPSTGHLVIDRTGLYQLTWVNSYSWLNAKHIRYRVTVFTPSNPETKPKTKAIQVINDTELPNLIPIGIWITNKIQVMTQGSITEIPSISNIYEILSRYPQNSNFSMGVVGPNPLHIPKLNVAGLCTCTDSDALLFLGFDLFGPNLIISIVQHDQLRVSVGSDRMIIFSCTSQLSVSEELGNLLNIFGPSFVIIAGDDINIKSIEKQLENYTSTENIQESLLRSGNELVLKAASRLFAYSKELYKES